MEVKDVMEIEKNRLIDEAIPEGKTYTPMKFLEPKWKKTQLYKRDEIKLAYFKEKELSLLPFLKTIGIWRNTNTVKNTKGWFREKKSFMRDAFVHVKSKLERKFEEGTEELYWELWAAKAECLRIMIWKMVDLNTSNKDRDMIFKTVNLEIWVGDFRDIGGKDKTEGYKINILSGAEDDRKKNTLRDADEGIEEKDYYLTKKEIEW